MGKMKAGVSNINSVSSSDDTDNSVMENTVDTSFPASPNSNLKKKNVKKKEFLKRERSDVDSGSDSEIEYHKAKSFKYVVGDTPNKMNKKVKKNTKQEISSGNSSDEDVINESFNNPSPSSPDKTKLKMKKKGKKKSPNINKLLKKDYTSIVKEESESDVSNEQIYLQSIIKKEVVSDDAELDSEESMQDHNSTLSTFQTVIKNEMQSDSNSEDAEDEMLSSEPQPKYPVPKNRSLTILQDIRLTSKAKSVEEKLGEMYPGLKPMEITTKLKISDSDEIHLFRIPKNVDPKSLKRVEIDLEDECQVNSGEEKYIITPVNKVPDPTLVISADPRVLLFKNNIKMETYVKNKNKPDIQIPEKRSVPLPENLKKRHPLFGSDFQHKIKLNANVERKLDEVIANLLKRERKAKKKKDKKRKHEETEPKQEIFDLFNSLASHDRIKKEASDDSAFGSSSSIDRPRGSKKKDKGHSLEKNIEETGLQTEKASSERKKEKKKKAKHQSQDSLDVSRIKKEVEDGDTIDPGEGTSTSSKKKMKRSIINSTLIPDMLNSPQFNSEVSTIESQDSLRKKSKKKRTPQVDSIKKEDLISELLNEVTMQVNAPKKIKTGF